MAEYVLPKFEVSIESPDHFTVKDKTLFAVVRAKYTYGKPLKGKAIVCVTEEDNFGCFRYRRESESTENRDNALVRKTIDVDGSGQLEFDIEKELKYDRSESNRYYSVRKFKINVELVENLTGLTQSTEKTIKVHRNAYEVSTDLDRSCLKRDSSNDVTVHIYNLS